jgi:hypothetical protein
METSLTERPWRIFLDGKFSHVAYAETGEQAIARETARLGTNGKGATTLIRATLANSASD